MSGVMFQLMYALKSRLLVFPMFLYVLYITSFPVGLCSPGISVSLMYCVRLCMLLLVNEYRVVKLRLSFWVKLLYERLNE